MDRKKIEKILLIGAVVFIVLGFAIMFGKNIFNGEPSNNTKIDVLTIPEATGTSSEIIKNSYIQQTFTCSVDEVENIAIVFYRLYQADGVDVVIELLDGNTSLVKQSIAVDKVKSQHRSYVTPASKLTGLKGKNLTLKVYPSKASDTGLAIMVNKDVRTTYQYGIKSVNGSLCFALNNK